MFSYVQIYTYMYICIYTNMQIKYTLCKHSMLLLLILTQSMIRVKVAAAVNGDVNVATRRVGIDIGVGVDAAVSD